MKEYSNISNFDELIEHEYGEIGSESRNEFDKCSKMFIECEMLKETELETNLVKEQLATKSMETDEFSSFVKSLSGL